jgi:hypothetical protein
VFYRLYTGDDGHSHFEELDMKDGFAAFEKMQKATGITFRRHESGNFIDWHGAPCRQYIITLQGAVEIGISDGTIKTFGPGDVMLADDIGGRGHTTRAVGNVPRISVAIPVE